MSYEVRVETVQRRYIASAKGLVKGQSVPEVAFPLSQLAWDFVKSHPEIPSTGINIWLYTGCVEGEGFYVEPGAEVSEPFEAEGQVACSATPEGKVVMTVNKGPYENIPKAYDAIRAWSEANNQPLSGTSWEVYGHWNEDPAELTTEIYYLLP